MRNSLPCAANLFFFLHIAKSREIVSFDYKGDSFRNDRKLCGSNEFYLMGITVSGRLSTHGKSGRCLQKIESILPKPYHAAADLVVIALITHF